MLCSLEYSGVWLLCEDSFLLVGDNGNLDIMLNETVQIHGTLTALHSSSEVAGVL